RGRQGTRRLARPGARAGHVRPVGGWVVDDDVQRPQLHPRARPQHHPGPSAASVRADAARLDHTSRSPGTHLGPRHRRAPLAGRRSVALAAFLAEALAADMTSETPKNGLVCTAANGEPLRRSNFSRRSWAPAIRAIGLEGLRFHDLRHTAVALAIAQGAHPKV